MDYPLRAVPHGRPRIGRPTGPRGQPWHRLCSSTWRRECRSSSPHPAVTLLLPADLAVGQAENYAGSASPLANLRMMLATELPAIDSRLVTYAYPENDNLDFREPDKPRVIRGDFFTGRLLELVPAGPFMPYPHAHTSIEVRSGASGGPVVDARGRVVGVNCRGWDFRGAEFEGNNLSSFVPLIHLLDAEVPILQLPADSWEYAQMPAPLRDRPHSLSGNWHTMATSS